MDKIGGITLINGDCLEYMRSLPDKAFDLAIVDPPYGGGGRYMPLELKRGELAAAGHPNMEQK